jgi:micrococcal nuclease
MFTKINLATLSCLSVLLCASPAIADPCEAPLPPSGTEFSGPVTYIVDGDGLCVGREQGGIEVRLADFYAAELREPGGEAAKAALARIAMGKEVTCVAGKKSYDRTIAVCKLGGQPLGDLMRAAGVPEGGRGRQ